MLNNILIYLKNFTGFGQGNARSNLAKKNIAASFVIKGLNITIGLLLIPLIINYLEPTRYGIWVTLSSIIGWFGFFDIGFGNGLRNRLAESLAKGNYFLARKYVSTTYAILSLIISGILILFFAINPLLNWTEILNTGVIIPEGELSLLATIVFIFFCIQFILKLITTVLTADQLPAIASVFDLIGKIFALLLILFLIKTTEGSLLYLGFIMSITPIIILIFASVFFYRGKYQKLRPSLKYVDFTLGKDLFSLGTKFFVIQIAVVLLYQTNNVIITHLFGPKLVTPYNVIFQYYSVLMMGFSILITPFWSAFTEAWTKNDLFWIKKIMNKLCKLWLFLVLVGIIMFLFSKQIILIWIGDSISISYSMSALVGTWVLLNTWNSIFSQFLNGVGKLKLQLYLGISAAILNVPFAIFLGKILGIKGVLLANIIVILTGVFIYPLQYKKIIGKNAKGIWNA